MIFYKQFNSMGFWGFGGIFLEFVVRFKNNPFHSNSYFVESCMEIGLVFVRNRKYMLQKISRPEGLAGLMRGLELLYFNVFS